MSRRRAPATRRRSPNTLQHRPDLAWAYDLPTRQLLPITGLISFYNEKVDVARERLVRPKTHFFK